jgi:hypothetical protein
LPAAEAREVERHLIDCLECRQAREDFLNLRSQIGAYASALDAARQQQVLANILSQPRTAPTPVPQSQPRRLRFSFGFSPAWAAVAALILFAVLVSLALYRSMRHVSPVEPERQAAVPSKPAPQTPTAPRVAATPEKTEIAKAPENKHREIRVNESRQVPVKPDSLNDNPNAIQLIDVAKLRQAQEQAAAEAKAAALAAVASAPVVRSADSQTLTALHLERSELLLRSFRNVKPAETEGGAELSYERQRAQQLLYQNMMLRREADTAGDVQVATLLESLEPILLDIANLPADAKDDEVRAIQDRVQRKNIVALLQVNSNLLAKALD